jgi:uncharacterized protein
VIVNSLAWIWKASAQVCEGEGIVLGSRRVRFFARALCVYDALKPFIHAPPESALGRLVAQRPETVGAAIWPYQCLSWNARTRLARIRDHCSTAERIGRPLDFEANDRLRLLDLSEIRPSLHVVLDQPRWFMREGQFAINLFLNETRLYSLVFSLFRDGDVLTAFVGAIQGRDIEGILEEYRDLTKAAHGMRPRDLLIEIFRLFGQAIGLTRILAVSDENRQHRSSYYGESASTKINVDYNEIWEDRGGIRIDPTCYRLDVQSSERELDAIPAKKRGMYRRRYAMLRALGQQMQLNWRELVNAGNRGEEPAANIQQSIVVREERFQSFGLGEAWRP